MPNLQKLTVEVETNLFCLKNYKLKARWKSCAHFVINKRAKLIHRPKSVNQYEKHIAVGLMCGGTFSAEFGIFDFTNDLNSEVIVCARCEAYALENGHDSAQKVTGLKHVHIGGVRPYKLCCDEVGAK